MRLKNMFHQDIMFHQYQDIMFHQDIMLNRSYIEIKPQMFGSRIPYLFNENIEKKKKKTKQIISNNCSVQGTSMMKRMQKVWYMPMTNSNKTRAHGGKARQQSFKARLVRLSCLESSKRKWPQYAQDSQPN